MGKFEEDYVEIAPLWVSKSGKSLTGHTPQPRDKKQPRQRVIISSDALLIYLKEKEPKTNGPVARLYASREHVMFEEEGTEPKVDEDDIPF